MFQPLIFQTYSDLRSNLVTKSRSRAETISKPSCSASQMIISRFVMTQTGPADQNIFIVEDELRTWANIHKITWAISFNCILISEVMPELLQDHAMNQNLGRFWKYLILTRCKLALISSIIPREYGSVGRNIKKLNHVSSFLACLELQSKYWLKTDPCHQEHSWRRALQQISSHIKSVTS